MDSLRLSEHLPFLLCGLKPDEQVSFLTALKPMSFDQTDASTTEFGPTFSSYDDFVERFEDALPSGGLAGFFKDKLARYQSALKNVELFFSAVVDVVHKGPDLFYALKDGAGVLVNLDDKSGWDATDVFGAVEYAAQYDEAIDLTTTLDGIDNIARLDFDATVIDPKFLTTHTTEQIVVIENLVASLNTDVCDEGGIDMTGEQIETLVGLVSKNCDLEILTQVTQNLIDLYCDSNLTADKFISLVKKFSSVTYNKTKMTSKGPETYQVQYALSGTEINEAMSWYFSEDLAWLKSQERMSIIRSSFVPTVVADREANFTRYFGSADYEAHRQFAEEYLYGEMTWSVRDSAFHSQSLSAVRVEKWFGTDVNMDELMRQFSIVVLAESGGAENAENGAYKGLMQVHQSKFDAGEDWSDPQTNIGHGLDELFGYSMGEARNKNKSVTRAIANYNAGAGCIIDYDKGAYQLTPETLRYLRDYLIYSRFV